DITIVVDTLHQRRCAVSDAHNRNPNASVLAHAGSPSFSVCALYGLGFLAALFGLFVRDQLVEPAHLPFAGLQPELVQLTGVAVDLLLGPRQRGPQPLTPFLHPATPALQDPHAHVGRSTGKERHVDAETLVVPGLRTRVGDKLRETLLALGGQLVDPPGFTSPTVTVGHPPAGYAGRRPRCGALHMTCRRANLRFVHQPADGIQAAGSEKERTVRERTKQIQEQV